MGGTEVLPAVAGQCAASGVACVSTALPWQVHRDRVGVTPWAFHLCWGIDDIGAVFAALWMRVAPDAVVGCLWNDGPQGAALRDPRNGFLPEDSTVTMLDPGGYPEHTAEFAEFATYFAERRVEVITSAAVTTDLARFLSSPATRGYRPALVTCSRWLAYPFGMDHPALRDVATAVAWTPRHPYMSSVDAESGEYLAQVYERETGRQWLPLLGLGHAVLETAIHALTRAASASPESVAETLATIRLSTIAGVVDFARGPFPGVSLIPLAAGQWHFDPTRRPRLNIVDPRGVPGLDTESELVLRAR